MWFFEHIPLDWVTRDIYIFALAIKVRFMGPASHEFLRKKLSCLNTCGKSNLLLEKQVCIRMLKAPRNPGWKQDSKRNTVRVLWEPYYPPVLGLCHEHLSPEGSSDLETLYPWLCGKQKIPLPDSCAPRSPASREWDIWEESRMLTFELGMEAATGKGQWQGASL